MASRDSELFQKSFHRCVERPEFLERFYDGFMAASPDVRARFADTDLAKRKRILRASLHMIALAADDRPGAVAHLHNLAERHGMGQLDIRPALYDVWLEALVAAVRQTDPKCSPDIEAAWRDAMAPGIRYMRSHHDPENADPTRAAR